MPPHQLYRRRPQYTTYHHAGQHHQLQDSQHEPGKPALADLPPLVLQRITILLDPSSRLELRKVDKRCKQVVDQCFKLVCLPLEQIRHHGMDELAARFPAAACLVVSAPQTRVSLSVLGHRRRCEQQLAVFLDNAVHFQWPTLVALDLSQAVASISSTTLQVLGERLPALQHLALPKVAASSGGTAEVLQLISQLPQLCSCEMDCSLLGAKCQQGGRQRSSIDAGPMSPEPQHSNSAAGSQRQPQLQQQPQQMNYQPQQQQAQQQHQHQQQYMLLHSPSMQPTQALPLPLLPANQAPATAVVSTVNSNTSTAPNASQQHGHSIASSSSSSSPTPGVKISTGASPSSSSIYSPSSRYGSISTEHQQQDQQQLQQQQLRYPCNPYNYLNNLHHLQQLQLIHPCCLEDLLPALAGLKGLGSLGLVGVPKGISSQLLYPGQQGGSAELGNLKSLQFLTRLELGLEQQCSCSSSGSQGPNPPQLIIPPHLSTDSNGLTTSSTSVYSMLPGTSHSCCWSTLTQLRVLVLLGMCLDSPLLAATAQCSRLTEMKVGGVQLEQELPAGFSGLQELRVLSVLQLFHMGPNMVAALFPSLVKLSIRDDSNSCPDLACLKYHPCLSSLSIEAAGSGWALSALQLGYLVHLSSLKQLTLASGVCDSNHASASASTSSSSSSSGRCGVPPVGVGMTYGGGNAAGSAGGCCMSSSHWLPTASLTQVTSLTLSGPATDHTLTQLPTQFPSMVALQLIGSYYASDWGLKRLCRAPQLSALLLENCVHVTEHGVEVLMRGGGIRVLVVHGCGGVDERACQRIRRACRNSCTCLHWHGTDGSSSSNRASTGSSSHISPYFDTDDGKHCSFNNDGLASSSSQRASASCCGSCRCSSGSAFLERCWRESEAKRSSMNGRSASSPGFGACSQALGAMHISSSSCMTGRLHSGLAIQQQNASGPCAASGTFASCADVEKARARGVSGDAPLENGNGSGPISHAAPHQQCLSEAELQCNHFRQPGGLPVSKGDYCAAAGSSSSSSVPATAACGQFLPGAPFASVSASSSSTAEIAGYSNAVTAAAAMPEGNIVSEAPAAAPHAAAVSRARSSSSSGGGGMHRASCVGGIGSRSTCEWGQARGGHHVAGPTAAH